MGRAEAFAMQNGPAKSALDGLETVWGTHWYSSWWPFFRELFGSGSLFGVQLFAKGN